MTESSSKEKIVHKLELRFDEENAEQVEPNPKRKKNPISRLDEMFVYSAAHRFPD